MKKRRKLKKCFFNNRIKLLQGWIQLFKNLSNLASTNVENEEQFVFKIINEWIKEQMVWIYHSVSSVLTFLNNDHVIKVSATNVLQLNKVLSHSITLL